jgi:hypothetical protein
MFLSEGILPEEREVVVLSNGKGQLFCSEISEG